MSKTHTTMRSTQNWLTYTNNRRPNAHSAHAMYLIRGKGARQPLKKRGHSGCPVRGCNRTQASRANSAGAEGFWVHPAASPKQHREV